ncbi:MAG: hydantoinase/oxoprolinase family protein, partial [Pseudomonadota bacterium]
PGPACYGRSGERPAVTDADLILGKLDPANFAGGSIRLHPERSEAALMAHVGERLGMDTEAAAYGVAEVVDETMANAARVHAVENGEDLSGYTMIAFGGAAPLHAGRLSQKLGIGRVLVPPGAGVGSAIGFLRAPFSFEATRSVYMRMNAFDPSAARALLAELTAEATGFVRSCDASAHVNAEIKLFMRYVGQGWEIPVALPPELVAAPDADAILALFEADYARLFSRTVEGLDVEVTVWAVNAATAPEPVERVNQPPAATGQMEGKARTLFDAGLGKVGNAREVARDALAPGAHVSGPAAVVEAETTVIVPAGYDVQCQPDGCLDLVVAHAAKEDAA